MGFSTKIVLINLQAWEKHAPETLSHFLARAYAEPPCSGVLTQSLPALSAWLGFLLGFRRWSSHSPLARELETTLYDWKRLREIVGPHGFSYKNTVPISLTKTDSLTKMTEEYARKPMVASVFKSLGVQVTPGDCLQWHGLGPQKLQQFILLARMALSELVPLPSTDTLWTDSFLSFTDRETSVELLTTIAAWPISTHHILLTKTI